MFVPLPDGLYAGLVVPPPRLDIGLYDGDCVVAIFELIPPVSIGLYAGLVGSYCVLLLPIVPEESDDVPDVVPPVGLYTGDCMLPVYAGEEDEPPLEEYPGD